MTLPVDTGAARTRLASFDVSAVLPFGQERNQITAQLHWPAGAPKAVLVCWPGGSYARSYWEFNGAPGYSFAQYMGDLGFAVVAADPLGVGESSRPADVDGVTLEVMAQAAAEFARHLRSELRLAPGIPFIGVGHSLGGCLTIISEALASCYDRVVSLGYTHGAKDAVTASASDQRDARAAAVEQAKAFFVDWEAGYATAPREPNHGWLYTPSTPPDVIAADDATVAAWPRQAYVDALLSGYTVGFAAKLACPVLLVFGDHDIPDRPHEDVAFYPNVRDISLVIAADSGHSHNFSPSRFAVWKRIAEWALQPAMSQPETT